MGEIGVRVLGPVEVVSEAGPVRLAAMQTRLLAALLVGGNQARSLDELVEAIWDERAPQSARKLVQVYVSQLRKVLPAEAIQTVDGGYAARLESGALDADRFERLLRECGEARDAGNAALVLSLVEQALALWRGRAYGELGYEDFARGESERLEELRLEAIEERFAAALELGRATAVLGDVLAHADANVLRERSHELAMLALYRVGRQADALAHYASFRARLDDELGLEPGPALRELQRRILQQDPGLDLVAEQLPAGQALPTPPNELVGRERELEELRSLLDRRETRLVVLTGAGGSGKTRLALEVARQVAGSYANGVAFIELASLRESTLVVPTIAQALDVPVDAEADPLEAVVDAVAAHELLLLVDNAEHVREAAASFAVLVARAPRLTVLVTSRAVLHVSGEHVIPVAPLHDDAAIELFAQRARALDATFTLTGDNESDVREICRRVDCLPLAVELAAARIRALTPRALRERLDARLKVLTGGPRDLPARQQTLRETIAWSVELLAEGARSVLARLAISPAGATLEAAEQVCGADLDTLTALVDDHLIRRDEVAGEPRFGMLETIREYALELLGEEQRSTALAMAAYLAELAETVEVEARTRTQALSKLDPEIDNIRAALDACAEAGDAELELWLAGGTWRYWLVRGLAGEGIGRIERALAAHGGATTVSRAQALRGAAGLAWALGDLERAKELARAALPVAVEAGSTWDEMATNTVLGVVANVEGDRSLARRHHRRSMDLAEQLGFEPIVQKNNLGVIALDEADYPEAQVIFEDVLAIHRQNENVEGIGNALLNLGVVHHALGEHETSLRVFEEARTCFEEVGFRAHVAHAVQGFAAFAASEGRFEDAARLLGQARGELDEIGSPEGDFAIDMVAWTKEQAREALGEDAFEAAYAEGRERPA